MGSGSTPAKANHAWIAQNEKRNPVHHQFAMFSQYKSLLVACTSRPILVSVESSADKTVSAYVNISLIFKFEYFID